jgi:voltage-gated potassium channel
LELGKEGDILSRLYDYSLIALIILNAAVLLESIQPLADHYHVQFAWFEAFSVGIFTIEYVLRLWSCVENQHFQSQVKGRLQYALSPMALIDLLAFLPFFLSWILPLDLRILRMLRLVRLVRLLKLARYSEALRALGHILASKKEEMVITLGLGVILLTISSSLMYFAEHHAQPEIFSSIPAAMWWGVVTLTTVGYGDLYPVTTLGKILGAFIAVLGIGMFALPAGIFGAGIVEWAQKKRSSNTCPLCGEKNTP